MNVEREQQAAVNLVGRFLWEMATDRAARKATVIIETYTVREEAKAEVMAVFDNLMKVSQPKEGQDLSDIRKGWEDMFDKLWDETQAEKAKEAINA